MSPRERKLEDRSKFWIGMIAVGVVAAIIASMLLYRQIGFGYTRYQAEFAQAAQLKKGDYVSVAGVDVGEVKSVVLDGTKVLVDLRVRDEVKLGAETQAAIKTTTLLGSRYIELRPRGAGTIPNKRIALSHTEVPYDLQSLSDNQRELKETLDLLPLLLDNVDRSIDPVNGSLRLHPMLDKLLFESQFTKEICNMMGLRQLGCSTGTMADYGPDFGLTYMLDGMARMGQ